VAHRGRQNADEALATALAAGQTLRAAAAVTGVSERTATRRWADPDFRSRVSHLRGELVGHALGKLADGMSDAAAKLRELLSAQSEAVRLGAARALLELSVKLRESTELEERLRVIEERLTQTEPIVSSEASA
jgi:hypothetical protein